MTLSPNELNDLVGLAERLADAAAAETVPRFRQRDLHTEDKTAGNVRDFDPVTAADRGAEAAIRAVLGQTRRDDAIHGEEEGQSAGRSGLTWVIDPIDGTRAYISGLPTWGTLIALDDGTRGRIGVVDQPWIGERFVGVLGQGARLTDRLGVRQIDVRTGRSLAEATLFTTDPGLFTAREATAFTAVRNVARLTRYGTDCYAYALLALGQIDLVIESGLHAYDIAAPKVLVEAAGGLVTDWAGGDCRWGGQVVAAATRGLHAEALAMLGPAAERAGADA